jgi:methionine synthase II (cobalamin-independent)
MKRSTDRILATHTGSLPLPPLIRQACAAKRRGEAYDQAMIDAALTTAISEVVRRQIDDGELSKTSWNDYVVHRLSGLERKPRSRARSAESWSIARGILRPRETGMARVDIEGAPRHYRTDIAFADESSLHTRFAK